MKLFPDLCGDDIDFLATSEQMTSKTKMVISQIWRDKEAGQVCASLLLSGF
jgi:hypothetical protein